MKTASLCDKRNPTNANTLKFKKAQRELSNIYQKEQLEYIQGQINKMINSVEDRQSWKVWPTVNIWYKRKSTSIRKLKAVNQDERIYMWKEHFKNLLGDSPKVIDKFITKIIYSQLDIKLGQFNQEVLNVVLKKN